MTKKKTPMENVEEAKLKSYKKKYDNKNTYLESVDENASK